MAAHAADGFRSGTSMPVTWSSTISGIPEIQDKEHGQHHGGAMPAAGLIGFAHSFHLSSAPLEELHRALMALGGRTGTERAEIPALACLRILLTRVEAVLAGCEFSNHAV